MVQTSMPQQLPQAVKLIALGLDAQGHKQTEIAEQLAISIGTITNAKRKMKNHGDVEGGRRKRGPKPKMDPGMEIVRYYCFLHPRLLST